MEALLGLILEDGTALAQASRALSNRQELGLVIGPVSDLLEATPEFHRQTELLTHPDISGVAADPEASGLAKAAGASAFSRREYETAARHYTDALELLDESAGGDAATLACRLLCNRALCLLRAQVPQPREAVEDCTVALELDPSFAKAWYRRASAKEMLGVHHGALADATRAVELLQHRPPGETEDVRALLLRLGQLLAGAPDSQETQPKNGELDGPTVLGKTVGSDLQAAVDLVTEGRAMLRQEPGSGRGLAAAVQLGAGTDLWRETPAAMVTMKAHRRKVCSVCLRPVPRLAALPCPRCRLESYCSGRCRALATATHCPDTECGLPWTKVLPEMLVLATRAAAKDSLLSHLEAHPEVAVCLSSREEMARSLLLACVASTCFNTAAERSAAGSRVTPARVLAALLKVEVNGIAIVPAANSSRQDRVALGLYPVTSMLNHSCTPTVSLSFDGPELVMRSVRQFEEGHFLHHCYGPEYGASCRSARRSQLERQYGFTCHCRVCTSMDDGSKVVGFACPSPGCRGSVHMPQPLPPNVCAFTEQPEGDSRCTVCRDRLPAAQADRAVASARRALQAMEEASSLHSPGQQIPLVLKALELRSEVLHPCNQLIGATNHVLKRLFIATRDWEKASDHARQALKSIQAAYQAGSTQEAFERVALAQLLAAGGEDEEEAAAQAEAARQVLQLYFGHRCGQLQDLDLVMTLCSTGSPGRRETLRAEIQERLVEWATAD